MAPPSGRPEVKFLNSTQNTIYVAYMRREYACQTTCGYPWDVLGWIELTPGETESRPNPTENRWFYYYGEDTNGGVYGGDYPAEVKPARFQKCECLGVLVGGMNPYHTVGFDELDTKNFGGVEFV